MCVEKGVCVWGGGEGGIWGGVTWMISHGSDSSSD